MQFDAAAEADEIEATAEAMLDKAQTLRIPRAIAQLRSWFARCATGQLADG